MRDRLRWVVAAVLAAALAAAGTARAAVTLTFDDLPDPGNGAWIPAGYGGFDWENLGYLNAISYINNPSGYQAGMVSPTNVAFNSGGDPGAVIITGDVPFTFNSVYLTGAWNDDLNITVEGYYQDILAYSETVVASAVAPTLFEFNYSTITRLVFTSSGGTPYPGYLGGGTQFAMDNFTFTPGLVAYPEPATLISGGTAVLFGLGYGLRRRRRAA